MLDDVPIIADGDPGSIVIPLDHEDVLPILSMPLDKKKEMVRTIKDYIRQIGRDYGSDKRKPDSKLCV